MLEWIRDIPWRQGHLLTDEAVESLGLLDSEQPGDTIVIIATHDCDLAQSPENEPQVEVVVGHRIDGMNGNYTHAKTSRTLHLGFEGDTALLAEFVITAKRSIRKEALLDFAPLNSHRLTLAGRATFQRWLAARYHRSAFPDEFERRLIRETKLAEKLAKAVKPHGDLIVAVLFDVDEGDEQTRTGADDPYVLDITLLYAVEPDFDKAEAAASTAVKAIRSAFEAKLLDRKSGKWQFIELRYCDAISEEALSYRDFRMMKPWRLEYVSLGAVPQQTTLVA